MALSSCSPKDLCASLSETWVETCHQPSDPRRISTVYNSVSGLCLIASKGGISPPRHIALMIFLFFNFWISMHEIFPPIFFEPHPNFVFVHAYIRAYQADTFKGFLKKVLGHKALLLLDLGWCRRARKGKSKTKHRILSWFLAGQARQQQQMSYLAVMKKQGGLEPPTMPTSLTSPCANRFGELVAVHSKSNICNVF